ASAKSRRAIATSAPKSRASTSCGAAWSAEREASCASSKSPARKLVFARVSHLSASGVRPEVCASCDGPHPAANVAADAPRARTRRKEALRIVRLGERLRWGRIDAQDAIGPKLPSAATRQQIAHNPGRVEIGPDLLDDHHQRLRRAPRGPIKDARGGRML